MKTLILGIGNDILTDDGIGPKLVRELEGAGYPGDIVFSSNALGGLETLEIMKDHDRTILIDAIKTPGGIPGDIYYFTPDCFKETLHLSNLHDVNFLTAMELGKRLGYKIPEDIHIIAVEIVEDRIFSSSFSSQIESIFPDILRETKVLVNNILKGALLPDTVGQN